MARQVPLSVCVFDKHEAACLNGSHLSVEPSSLTVRFGSGTVCQATLRMPAGTWVMRTPDAGYRDSNGTASGFTDDFVVGKSISPKCD